MKQHPLEPTSFEEIKKTFSFFLKACVFPWNQHNSVVSVARVFNEKRFKYSPFDVEDMVSAIMKKIEERFQKIPDSYTYQKSRWNKIEEGVEAMVLQLWTFWEKTQTKND